MHGKLIPSIVIDLNCTQWKPDELQKMFVVTIFTWMRLWDMVAQWFLEFLELRTSIVFVFVCGPLMIGMVSYVEYGES